MANYNAAGWTRDTIGTDEFNKSLPRMYSDQLVNLPRDLLKPAFPYRHLQRALTGSRHVKAGRLRASHQGNFGSCVGFATSRACDVVAACDIFQRGDPEIWPTGPAGKPVVSAPDYVYAASRHVVNKLGKWQGSYGAAAAKAMRLWGIVHQQIFSDYDLTEYSTHLCRIWSARGVPRAIRLRAEKHPYRSTVRVETCEQAVALLQNGYAFNLCCSLGWSDRRDDFGFSRRVRPGWSHAQAVIGYVVYQKSNFRSRAGFIIQNSWGNRWNSGPTGVLTPDLPGGSFVCEWDDMQTALDENDSFAFGNYDGFNQSPYDWENLGW